MFESSGILMPHIKLNGGNYKYWAMAMKVFLKAYAKFEFITSNPPSIDSQEYKEWKTGHNQVISWLLQSMEFFVIQDILDLKTAKEIWDTLRETYSIDDHVSRVYDLYEKMFRLEQGRKTVKDYYNALKGIIDEINQCHPLTSDLDVVMKQREEFYVCKFFSGLRGEFEEARNRKLAEDSSLPSLLSAYERILDTAAFPPKDYPQLYSVRKKKKNNKDGSGSGSGSDHDLSSNVSHFSGEDHKVNAWKKLNVSRVYALYDKMLSLKQGEERVDSRKIDVSVVDYYKALIGIIDELYQYHPLTCDLETLKQQREEFYVCKFLSGLRGSLRLFRNKVLAGGGSRITSLSSAYHHVLYATTFCLSDEIPGGSDFAPVSSIRKKDGSSGDFHGQSSNGGGSFRGGRDRDRKRHGCGGRKNGGLPCSHCGRENHTVDTCYDLHGKPHSARKPSGQNVATLASGSSSDTVTISREEYDALIEQIQILSNSAA